MVNFIEANIHHFKTHISKFIRILERGEAKGVIVKRHGRPVGVFIHYKKESDGGDKNPY